MPTSHARKKKAPNASYGTPRSRAGQVGRREQPELRRAASAPTITRSPSSSAGTVPSRAWRSTVPWSSATGSTSNSYTTPRRRSTSAWPPFDQVAYEAADAGLLSPELAAGIRRVKGLRRLGVRLGNWLTADQGRRLLHYDRPPTLRAVREPRDAGDAASAAACAAASCSR